MHRHREDLASWPLLLPAHNRILSVLQCRTAISFPTIMGADMAVATQAEVPIADQETISG